MWITLITIILSSLFLRQECDFFFSYYSIIKTNCTQTGIESIKKYPVFYDSGMRTSNYDYVVIYTLTNGNVYEIDHYGATYDKLKQQKDLMNTTVPCHIVNDKLKFDFSPEDQCLYMRWGLWLIMFHIYIGHRLGIF